jgi:hypothetical protein
MPGAPVVIEARVMNHSAKPKDVRAELTLPADWQPGLLVGTQRISAGTEGRIRLDAMGPSAPDRRRHVIGLTVSVDSQPLGEFAEAIVDFLT